MIGESKRDHAAQSLIASFRTQVVMVVLREYNRAGGYCNLFRIGQSDQMAIALNKFIGFQRTVSCHANIGPASWKGRFSNDPELLLRLLLVGIQGAAG